MISEIKGQYEQEKMSKEALLKKMDAIKVQYDAQMILLETADKPKKGENRKSGKSKKEGGKKQQVTNGSEEDVGSDTSEVNTNNGGLESVDPEQRLKKLEELMVGGEQANNEELKKKRIKKKKYAEERKKLLADALRKGDDDEFMLRVYDSVQEEIQFKSKLFEKEKEKAKFLENEVKDLQVEFEREREDLLDTIRKNEKQIKLLGKILQKIQPLIPYDSNYYNLDKIQSVSVWNEEGQDWTLPEYKIEKLSLPTMGPDNDTDVSNNGDYENSESNYSFIQQQHQQQQQTILLNGRRNELNPVAFLGPREPEIDRYRLKLENSQYDGSNYFKNKRAIELLGQTQEMRNGKLSPLTNNPRANRRYP